MKKFLTMIASLAVVIALLSGCGGTESTTSSNDGGEVVEPQKETQESSVEKSTVTAEVVSVDDFMTWLEDKVDTSKYKISDPTDSLVSYNLKSENKTDYDLDCKITLDDGTAINMPVPVKKLVDQGWEPNNDSDMDVELKAGYSTSNLFKKGDVKLTVYSVNRSDETATYGDGDVHRVLFDLYNSSDNYAAPLSSGPDFNICGSINNGSDIDDVISLLGDPTEISYTIIGDNAYAHINLEFNNSTDREYLRLEFNADGSKIVNVDYECDVRE